MWTCLAQCCYLGDALGASLLSFPSGQLPPPLSPNSSLLSGTCPCLCALAASAPPPPPLGRALAWAEGDKPGDSGPCSHHAEGMGQMQGSVGTSYLNSICRAVSSVYHA